MTAAARIAGAEAGPERAAAARPWIYDIGRHGESLVAAERAPAAWVPLAFSVSPFDCRECGEALAYGRVFAIAAAKRAIGRHACKPDWLCSRCEP